MIEAIFFIGMVVLITGVLVGILKFIQAKELNVEYGIDNDKFLYNGKMVWACAGRDHFNRDGLVWHYTGNVCERWSKLK